jgi:hypothetical protein
MMDPPRGNSQPATVSGVERKKPCAWAQPRRPAQQLILGLDAFGDHVGAQRSRQRKDAPTMAGHPLGEASTNERSILSASTGGR